MPRPADTSWYLGECNYTCLYALATIDAQGARTRHSLQVLHENDPCACQRLGTCAQPTAPRLYHCAPLACATLTPVWRSRRRCCFYGNGRHARIEAYDKAVAVETEALGGGESEGSFATAITDWNVHAVCQMDRLVIKAAKAQVDGPKGQLNASALPCDILRSAALPCPYAPPLLLPSEAGGNFVRCVEL